MQAWHVQHIVSQLLARNPDRRIVVAVLGLAVLLLAVAATQRGTEYDEGYTLLLTTGHARPVWPSEPASAAALRATVAGTSDLGAIAGDLRTGDVHPPLYFWTLSLWQRLAGGGTVAARGLSVLFGVGALALVGVIARLGALPPAAAMLLTLGCYGFAYVSHIARGFALAQVLTLGGVAMIVAATGRDKPARARALTLAIGGGALLGAAVLSNYLAAFIGAATLVWLLWRSPRLFAGGVLAFAACLPAALSFFIDQRGSRAGQFPAFDAIAAVARLAQYAAGAVFGALPLYAPGVARPVVAAALAAALAALFMVIVARWRHFGAPATNVLLALAAAAPPLGLLTLGLAFDTTPIELRYLAFATPFVSLLLAGAILSLGRRGPMLLACVVAIQAASIAGLLTRPESAQPQRAAARAAAALAGPDGLVLVAFGHDGVGVTYPFVAESPDATRLLVVPSGADAAWIARRTAPYPRAVVARLGLDTDSRAALAAIESGFAADRCWRVAAEAANLVAFIRFC